MEIELTHGLKAKIDDEESERVNQHKWHASLLGNGKGHWYAATSINNKTVYLHRFIMNPPRGMVVDHIDGDSLNCIKLNMRICTQAQNAMNSRKKQFKHSKYKGVGKHWFRWVSYIVFNKKKIHIATHATEEQAARAYDAKAKELFGEYALLNFPE